MRRSLLWALLATLALSAAALFIPSPDAGGSDSPGTDAVAATSPASAPAPGGLVAGSSSPELTLAPLPLTLPATALEPPKRDIFGLAAPPVDTKPPPAAVVPTVYVPPPVASPPPAPPMAYRYWGRMTTPEGQLISYLVKADDHGDNVVPIVPGTTLDDGWQVQALAEDSVTLVHPALEQRMVIPIASAQSP